METFDFNGLTFEKTAHSQWLADNAAEAYAHDALEVAWVYEDGLIAEFLVVRSAA